MLLGLLWWANLRSCCARDAQGPALLLLGCMQQGYFQIRKLHAMSSSYRMIQAGKIYKPFLGIKKVLQIWIYGLLDWGLKGHRDFAQFCYFKFAFWLKWRTVMDGEKKFLIENFWRLSCLRNGTIGEKKNGINIVIGCLVGYIQTGTCSRRHLKLEQQKKGS